jgi:hypothetical protein
MTRRRWIVTIAAVAVVIGLGVGVVHLRRIPGQTRPHQQIGTQAQTLRDAFNTDAGTVRVLALVSPTCGACLRGAADLQHDVFAAIGDAKLRGYIVWVPKLHGHEFNVDEATHTVADTRATHYWDADGYLVHAYDTILGLHQDAWDVYLLYRPDARWDGPNPPAPTYWMTQLGGAPGPALDARTFADHTRTLLADAHG